MIHLHTFSTSCEAGRALKGKPVGGGGSVVSNKAGGMYIGLAGIGKALPQPSFISNVITSFPADEKKRDFNNHSLVRWIHISNRWAFSLLALRLCDSWKPQNRSSCFWPFLPQFLATWFWHWRVVHISQIFPSVAARSSDGQTNMKM